MTDVNNWWAENKANGQTSILFGYTLGKAPLLKYLDTDIGKIYTHGAIENMTNVLRQLVDFPPTTRITAENKREDLPETLSWHHPARIAHMDP
jgi:putative mRNA 3-end processing factor